MVQSYTRPAAAPRRRRRWPVALLVVVVMLVGLFVAGDRVALALAEDKAATTLQSSQHLSQKPTVSVAGFPFLTQLLAGEFDDVTITAKGVDVGAGRSLRISSVTVHLHHVTVPRDYSSVRAETATADARIAYSDLSGTLGVPVRAGSDGRLVAEPSVTIAGRTVHGTVSAVVHASSGRGITFTQARVSALGETLPSAASDALAAVFGKVISLQGLPFNVEVTGADVTATGLVLHLAGQNLVYSRG